MEHLIKLHATLLETYDNLQKNGALLKINLVGYNWGIKLLQSAELH